MSKTKSPLIMQEEFRIKRIKRHNLLYKTNDEPDWGYFIVYYQVLKLVTLMQYYLRNLMLKKEH